MPHVWDFIKEFSEALQEQLEQDEKRWGNTWLQRGKSNQEFRIQEHIDTYFDQYREVGKPIPWLKIAGLAMIGWIRENHPELWEK